MGSASSSGPTAVATGPATAPGTAGGEKAAAQKPVAQSTKGFTGERNGNRYVKGLLLGETLGKGTFGYVKLGINEKDGTQYALKFLLRNARRFKEQTVKLEIDCMKKIKHKNVVNLLHSDYHCPYPNQEGKIDDTVLMVLEYAPGGDLYDILYYSGKLQEKLARTYYVQLLDALGAIHNAGITHRDLKANNILLDHKFRLKVTDFGLSHIYQGEDPNDNRMKTCWVGTKGYQAPELILNRPYSNKCDVFSTGVVLFTLLTGHQPFKRAAANDPWYKCIAAKKYYKFWKSHAKDQLSDAVKDILEKMMSYQPRERWSIEKLKQHKWTTDASYNEVELVQVMRKLHAKAVENKRNDPSRQERVQQSQVRNRAIGEGEMEAWTARFPDAKPPVVNFSLPAFDTYHLKEPESPLNLIYHIQNAAADIDGVFTWNPQQFKATVVITTSQTEEMKVNKKETTTLTHEFRLTITVRIVTKLVQGQPTNLVIFLREYDLPPNAPIDVQSRNEVYDRFLLQGVDANLGAVFHDEQDYSQYDYNAQKVADYFNQFQTSQTPVVDAPQQAEEDYPVLPDIADEEEEEVEAAPAQ